VTKPPPTVEQDLHLVCPTCGVYCRKEAFDGQNHYTVCAYCGRSELLIVTGREAVNG
jgi:Zn finger protein HypA/HybF involved in hydrogenase expression